MWCRMTLSQLLVWHGDSIRPLTSWNPCTRITTWDNTVISHGCWHTESSWPLTSWSWCTCTNCSCTSVNGPCCRTHSGRFCKSWSLGFPSTHDEGLAKRWMKGAQHMYVYWNILLWMQLHSLKLCYLYMLWPTQQWSLYPHLVFAIPVAPGNSVTSVIWGWISCQRQQGQLI